MTGDKASSGALRRLPFFYGWVVVAIAFVGSGIGSGVVIWGASVFVLPMTHELGWSRAAFFSALTVRSLIIAVSAPVVGPWLDTRHGPRVLMIAGAVILAVSMALLRYTEHLWQFILLYGVLGGLTETGSGFTIAQTVVPKWFIRKRGRALGISTMGVGLGALVFPGLVSAIVSAVGWREAWLYFGLGVGGVSLVLGLLVRTRPEDVGLLPDGAPEPPPRPATDLLPPVGEGRSLTRREALRAPAFWMLLAAFTFTGLGITGFQSNWLPFLLDKGFSSTQASAGIAVYGLLSGLSRPGWGFAGERIQARYLLAAASIVTTVIIVFFLNVGSLPLLAVYMFVAGISMGGYIILRALLVADYFGRRYLGAVDSLFRPLTMGVGALSPLLFGLLYDLRGDYVLAFSIAAAAWGAAGLVVLLAKPPVTKRAKA